MPAAEVATKASDLLVPLLGEARSTALIEAVWDLERTGNVQSLRPLLTVGQGSSG
jgi:hypothetical protein